MVPKLQSLRYTANGNFVVPANVSLVWVTMVGGGGGGAGSLGGNQNGGAGGGGSGEYCKRYPVAVTPLSVIAIVIGAAGLADNGGAGNRVAGQGGRTYFGPDVWVEGGYGGATNQGNFPHVGGATSGGGNGGGVGGLNYSAERTAGVTGGQGRAVGKPGSPEGPFFYGGSGGGGGAGGGGANGPPFTTFAAGGPCEGYDGGPGGSGWNSTNTGSQLSGGAGGGSSIFGIGGLGGGVAGTDTAGQGNAPPPGSYGAGGGGASSSRGITSGGFQVNFPGGAGLAGCCFVQWISPL